MNHKLIPIGRKSAREDPTASRERQEAVIAAWAARNPDVELLPMVWENSVSGSSDWQKRGLGEVIERIRSGEADGVIVENQDRLSRGNQLQAAGLWEALQGFRLVCVNDGLDTGDGQDHEMLFTIKAAIARDVAKNMAKRTDAMKRSKNGSGVYISSIPPFGYDRDERTKKLVPNGFAPVVTELFERRASGQSYTALCRWLDEVIPGGITGKGWTKQALKRFFKNPAYIGWATQGEYINQSAHPAIVDEVVFHAVGARRSRREATPAKQDEAALLAGIVRCGECGYAMSRATTGGYAVYRHRTGMNCPGPASINMGNLDSYVINEASDYVDRLPVPEAVDQSGDILARRDALRIERDTFQNPEYLRRFGASALEVVAGIEAELAALDGQLIALTGDRPSFPAWPVWDDLSIEARHRVLASVLRDVLVLRRPRGATVADRVRIVWFDEDAPVIRPARGRGDAKVEAWVEAA